MGAGAIVLGFGGLGGFAGLFRKQKSYGSGQPIMNYVDLVSNLATSGKWEIIQHSVNGVLKDNICPVMPVHAWDSIGDSKINLEGGYLEVSAPTKFHFTDPLSS
jgi:hypothetical protein